MAKTKLVVKTDIGEFTRTTARTYTHLVVAKGYRAERAEAGRLAAIQNAKSELAKCQRTVETGECQDARPGRSGDYDRQCTANFLADGLFAKWIAEYEAEVAYLEAIGPITRDLDNWTLSEKNLAAEPEWTLLGWAGRLDLARNVARSTQASGYREVRIYDVATGLRVAL